MSQPFPPIGQIHLGFHAYHAAAHDRSQVVESYHFCSGCGKGDDTVFQCLIYDSPLKDARLIGIEYLITEKLFRELDDEERKLWHSHKYEVSSGLLTPLQPDQSHGVVGSGGLRAADEEVEKGQMSLIYKTYGKIIHTWHPLSAKLPYGAPTLMMSATGFDKGPAAEIGADSDKSGDLIQKRDTRHAVDSVQQRKRRMAYLDLDYKTLDGADAWQDGHGRRFAVQECDVKLSNGAVLPRK